MERLKTYFDFNFKKPTAAEVNDIANIHPDDVTDETSEQPDPDEILDEIEQTAPTTEMTATESKRHIQTFEQFKA